MKKKNSRQYIGIALVSMLFATYTVSLVLAQTASLTRDGIPLGEISSIPIINLENQDHLLEQLSNELQNLYASTQPEIQQREQSSLSLREFSNNNLFSCRGLA